MIKIVLLDIDGVLTDGKVSVDQDGNERKQIDFKDIDAVFEMKRQGYVVGLITGEKTGMTDFFKRRFEPHYFYNGCKSKLEVVHEISGDAGIGLSEICYIGDGRYDIAPIEAVGFGVCPKNAIPEVKKAARMCLSTKGGDGCIWELLNILTSMSKEEISENKGKINYGA